MICFSKMEFFSFISCIAVKLFVKSLHCSSNFFWLLRYKICKNEKTGTSCGESKFACFVNKYFHFKFKLNVLLYKYFFSKKSCRRFLIQVLVFKVLKINRGDKWLLEGNISILENTPPLPPHHPYPVPPPPPPRPHPRTTCVCGGG